MTEKEACAILQAQGWACGKDEVSDRFCIKCLGEIQVQIIPTIGKRSDHFRVSFMPSISSTAFSDAVAFIFGEGKYFSSVIVSNETPQKLETIGADDVVELSDRALSWAQNQDIDAGLALYRSFPTDAKGAMPLRHLAALAIAQDVDQLEDYEKSFKKGERLGFVPYITVEMIERSLLIARGNAPKVN